MLEEEFESKKESLMVLTEPVLSLDMEDPIDFIKKFGSFDYVKVGHNLAINGKKVIDELYEMGYKIILDLKFSDIPSTVARSIRAWDHPGIVGFTMHANSGVESVKAALESTQKQIFSVIKLTSVIGKLEDYQQLIIGLSRLGSSFVLPGGWALRLRYLIGGKILVPGIRMEQSKDDQKDVVSLSDIMGIADYAVIGREVYKAKDPAGKIEEIKKKVSIWRE
ncbi:MAG: orotidine-5'-phosphate decarboxylase [Fervidobacterium sp.]